MNDHHIYDWIDEADIPKDTKIETSRWCDDLSPRDGDETSVQSRVVVQQYIKHDEVHQGTPPLKVLRMLLALATSKDAHRPRVCGIWDVSVAFFPSPMDEYTVRPPPGLRVRGKLWVLNRALFGTRMASRCFGKLFAEVLTDARFETVSFVPNTYHNHRETLTPSCTETSSSLLRKTDSWIISSRFSRIQWKSSESYSSVSSTGVAMA